MSVPGRTEVAGRSCVSNRLYHYWAGDYCIDGCVLRGESMEQDQFCVQRSLPQSDPSRLLAVPVRQAMSRRPRWLGSSGGVASLNASPPSSFPKTSTKGPVWGDGSVSKVLILQA